MHMLLLVISAHPQCTIHAHNHGPQAKLPRTHARACSACCRFQAAPSSAAVFHESKKMLQQLVEEGETLQPPLSATPRHLQPPSGPASKMAAMRLA